MYAIGIDRGGSYTRISIFDSSFKEIKNHNFISDSLENFVKETYNFIKEINAEKIPCVISCKGAMTKKEIRDYIIQNLSNKINLKAVISDAEGAHRAAFNDNNGFLIIIGTGSVLIYKKDGKYLIEGGKNPPEGDPGSGKWIGLKYLKSKNENYESWNDQLIASYSNEVIKKSKENKDELCLKNLNEAFMELSKLISEAINKLDNIDDLKIALIGGLSSSEYFINGLSNYVAQNIKKPKIQFFIPEMTIQKASALYAIKLNENNI